MATVIKRLRAAGKGARFDRAFMEAMVQDHQTTVDQVRQMASATSNDALRQQLDQTVPKLQEHLDHARDLAGKLGSRGGAAQAGGSQGGRNRNGR